VRNMADFSSGVSGYVVGEMHIKVFFPIDLKGRKDVCCCQCDYYGRKSKICLLNKKIVAYPEHYIGQDCPLKFNDDQTMENNSFESDESAENNNKTWKAGVF